MNHLSKLALAAILAAFFVSPAQAQNQGAVTNHAFALGKGSGTTGYTSLLCGSAQLAVGQAAADPICRTITGDVTITAAGVTAIGASKVANSMLATMAANTTKCNATAGTANPTDCNASTMRTNIGVVIGTNVEAWDADLDCVAALSSTGVISRTGSGTCSAGALALSGLATGTQDTLVGYFGSTTASATAVPNCSGALIYSTATHTFACNAAAGTGTVTNVIVSAGAGLVTSGTCNSNASISCAIAKSSGYVLLETLSPSASSSISTSVSWSSYHAIVIMVENLTSSSTGLPLVQVNSGGLQTTSYVSGSSYIAANGPSAWGTGTSSTTGVLLSPLAINGSANGFSGTYTIYNINAGTVKMIDGMGTMYNGSTMVKIFAYGGWTGGSGALSGCTFSATTGTISGTIKVYGIL